MKKPVKISLIVLGSALILSAIFIFIYPLPYIIYLKKDYIPNVIMGYDSIDYTFMYTRVTERTIPENNLPVTRYFTEGNIKMGVPFKQAPEIKNISGTKVYTFENGSAVVFFTSGLPFNLLNHLKTSEATFDNPYNILDKKAKSSEFELKKTIYNVTPDDLTFKASRNKAKLLSWELMMKSGLDKLLSTKPPTIFAFYGKNVEGMQFTSDNEVRNAYIEITDLYRMRFVKMTQEEIDTIINSIEIVK